MAYLLVLMRDTILGPITRISLNPSYVIFNAGQIRAKRHPDGYWKVVQLELPPGNWRNGKLTIQVTCGNVFDVTEQICSAGTLECLRGEIHDDTGINPSWIRYFDDDDNLIVYVFAPSNM